MGANGCLLKGAGVRSNQTCRVPGMAERSPEGGRGKEKKRGRSGGEQTVLVGGARVTPRGRCEGGRGGTHEPPASPQASLTGAAPGARHGLCLSVMVGGRDRRRGRRGRRRERRRRRNKVVVAARSVTVAIGALQRDNGLGGAHSSVGEGAKVGGCGCGGGGGSNCVSPPASPAGTGDL